MATIITPNIDVDIQGALWEEEQSWEDEGPERDGAPDPFVLVIFGITGDLAHRKLIPALFNLFIGNLLPETFAIVGFGRSKRTDDEIRDALCSSLEESGVAIDSERWSQFARRIHYVQGGYDELKGFGRLKRELDRLDQEEGTQGHRLFYLATPPDVFPDIIGNLGGCSDIARQETGWIRLVIEKPFGRDLATARQLDTCIHEIFDESQVYRIDHYLGKETVQNIFVMRFVNGIFEPLWNRNYVEQVQITVAEELGVEDRGEYYDTSGAVRDMLQSHLLQLLTLTAMEPPSTLTASKVHDEKVKVLDALQWPPGDVADYAVRGQYVRNEVNGQVIPGYREEPNVSPGSSTETFVAVKLLVDNWRWAGVPFYLRTGKRLPSRASEIAIQFRRAPTMFIPDGRRQRPRRNVLVLRIQPDDGMALRLDVKVPGPAMRVRPVDMSFLYKEAFEGVSPDAYQRLLLDVLRGDATLFTRADEVERAWERMEPLLDRWSEGGDLSLYAAGTWGPREADELLAADGHRWRHL